MIKLKDKDIRYIDSKFEALHNKIFSLEKNMHDTNMFLKQIVTLLQIQKEPIKSVEQLHNEIDESIFKKTNGKVEMIFKTLGKSLSLLDSKIKEFAIDKSILSVNKKLEYYSKLLDDTISSISDIDSSNNLKYLNDIGSYTKAIVDLKNLFIGYLFKDRCVHLDISSNNADGYYFCNYFNKKIVHDLCKGHCSYYEKCTPVIANEMNDTILNMKKGD